MPQQQFIQNESGLWVPLFNSPGVPAMDPNCCCSTTPPCDCNISPSPQITNLCTQCASTDFPTSFDTPRDWQMDISGVTSGSLTNCPTMCGNATAGTFYNQSLLFSPCSSAVILKGCAWICKTYNALSNLDQHLLQVDYLEAIAGQTVGGWYAKVTLMSWLVQRDTAPGFPTGSVCGTITWGPSGVTNSITLASSSFIQEFNRAYPTFQQYQWDPATCDPDLCINPILDVDGGCYPAGWYLTPSSPTTSYTEAATNCRPANDVTSASVSVYSV